MLLEIESIGCAHYQRHCLLQAPCCQKSYSCRRCHDDDDSRACTVDLNRHTVKHITCCTCGLKQLVGEDCLKCGQRFGLYFCAICRLYDDNTSKGQYHCIGCGSCRVGGRHNFKHCDTCGACYSRKNFASHGCVESALDRNCPVCLENLKGSTSELYAPRCGHILHKECHTHLLKRTMKCPICSRSYISFSSTTPNLDKQIEDHPLPPAYSNSWVHIRCQDCREESNAKYHPLGVKCTRCSSYKTTQVGEVQLTPDPASSTPTSATPAASNDTSTLQQANAKADALRLEAAKAKAEALKAHMEAERARARLRELEMIQNSMEASDAEEEEQQQEEEEERDNESAEGTATRNGDEDAATSIADHQDEQDKQEHGGDYAS